MTARANYRSWAEGQHDMWASTGVWAGEEPHRFGMNDADYAAAVARASNQETYPGGIGDPDNIGILASGQPEPGAAKAYAATHPVLCPHADQDGAGSHWLEPGERCAGLGQAQAALEAGQ